MRIDEGDTGTAIAKVSLTLDRPAQVDSVVQYRISGAGATPRVDFSAPASGVTVASKTVPAGRTEISVQVTVLNDTSEEPDEDIAVEVLSAPGLDVARARGDVTIVDDDGEGAPAPTPTLSIGAPTVVEGDTGVRHAYVPVTLSDPATEPISVTFESDGTLPAGWQNDDCQEMNTLTVRPVETTVSFSEGQQSKQVDLAVNGNVLPDQAFTHIANTATVTAGHAIVDPPEPAIVLDDEAANAATPPPPGTYRVSELADGSDPHFPPAVANTDVGCGYPTSGRTSLSADGRYVLFTSNADNLVGNDINGIEDVFVKDTWTGAIERVSTTADGTQGNNLSWARSISANGRYVTFVSLADNLVPDDGNSSWDAFVKDRQTGAIVRLGNQQEPGAWGSWSPFVGGDNRSVVFTADFPVAGSCTASCGGQVYLYDVVTGAYSAVTEGSSTTFQASSPVMSGDGRHVAFVQTSGTPGDTGVYVKDLDTGDVEMVSVDNAGQPLVGSLYAVWPSISYDGQVVAFTGRYCNAGISMSPCLAQVWVRNRTAGTLTVASVGPTGTLTQGIRDETSLSADGRYLLFGSTDFWWVPECPQGGPSAGGTFVWLRDLVAGTTERINTDVEGDACTQTILWGPQDLSSDGSSVVYTAKHDGDVSATNPENVYVTRRS